MYFNPNCRMRGSSALPTTPKLPVPKLWPGTLKLGWFAVLKLSQRICKRCRSVIAMLRCKDRSTLIRPGPSSGARPALPYVYCGGATKAVVSNQRLGVRADESRFGFLIKFGHCENDEPVSSGSPGSSAVNQPPLCAEKIPCSSQPPSTFPSTP